MKTYAVTVSRTGVAYIRAKSAQEAENIADKVTQYQIQWEDGWSVTDSAEDTDYNGPVEIGHDLHLTRLHTNGFSCSACGKRIGPEDLIACCSDCGGIFCEDCVVHGEFKNHDCDDGDLD